MFQEVGYLLVFERLLFLFTNTMHFSELNFSIKCFMALPIWLYLTSTSFNRKKGAIMNTIQEGAQKYLTTHVMVDVLWQRHGLVAGQVNHFGFVHVA